MRTAISPSYVFDDSAWPCVISTSPSGASAVDIKRYIELMNGIYARKRKFVTASFVSATIGSRENTKLFADWMKGSREAIRTYNCGTAFICASGMFRFVLSGLFLMQPLESPYEIFKSVESATPWLRKTLQQNGLPEPPNMVPLLNEMSTFARAT